MLTALWSSTDTSQWLLSALMGSIDKQLLQMNSVYLYRHAARHLSTQCKGPSIKSIQNCTGNVELSVSRQVVASRCQCKCRDLYNSLGFLLSSLTSQLTGCVAVCKVNPFAVIKLDWVGSAANIFLSGCL